MLKRRRSHCVPSYDRRNTPVGVSCWGVRETQTPRLDMHSSAMIAANALTTTGACNSISANNTVFFLPGRYYAVGGLCLACGVQVHTRPRLIHHLNHGTTECLAICSTNRHPFHNDEVERLDAIDRANRKTLRAVGLRETHAPHPATRLPYATSFVLPPDEDALLEARPPTGPSVLCDMPLPAVPGCFRFQKSVLPLVLIFAQGLVPCRIFRSI